MLAILRAGGLPPRLAVQGYLVLIATVNGFTVDETGVEDSGAPNRDPAHLQEAADMARDYVASLPASAFPNMTALAGSSRWPTRTSGSSCCSTCSSTGGPPGVPIQQPNQAALIRQH